MYVFSREMFDGCHWTEQAQQMLDQVRDNRVYLECVLQEEKAIRLQSELVATHQELPGDSV